MKISNLLLVTFFLFFVTACGGGGSSSSASGSGGTGGTGGTGGSEVKARGTLVSSKLLATKPSSLFIPYKVAAYKLVYYTIDVNGQSVKASGLLGVPLKGTGMKSPIISYQHGTIFLDEKAPSNSSISAKSIMILAGAGYIVSAPDYLGYGKSASMMHPYVHAKSLANASLDMLKAAKFFLKSKSVKTNNQLFLAGYSEGGYATLALQKAIQEQKPKGFFVTASAAGAGPFDLSVTSKHFANLVTNEKPEYMSFLLKSYDSIYHLNKVSEMYQSQYVSVINAVFDGKHSGKTIKNSLTETTANLFKPNFLSALKGTGHHVIKDKLALNNIYNWKPVAPTRFYHGPNDKVVPYSNAQKALATMQANGAANVSLGDCPLDTHILCAGTYVFDALGFFVKYANDL